MNLRTIVILIVMGFVFQSSILSQKKLDFFKHLPLSEPGLFGVGIISDEYGNRDMALAPNGKELMYTLQYKSGLFSAILISKKVKNAWTKPEIAPFSGKFNDLEPAYTPDGNRIYFASNRPKDKTGERKD